MKPFQVKKNRPFPTQMLLMPLMSKIKEKKAWKTISYTFFLPQSSLIPVAICALFHPSRWCVAQSILRRTEEFSFLNPYILLYTKAFMMMVFIFFSF